MKDVKGLFKEKDMITDDVKALIDPTDGGPIQF